MFESARLKLTSWYLVIIMCISLIFSGIVYQASLNEAARFEQLQRFRIERMGRLLVPLPANADLLEDIKHRILLFLAVINSGILLVSGLLDYILAGRTLAPIQAMVEDQHRFVSDASHELKTPLTSLKSAFEVYLRDSQRTKTEADILITESITEVDKLQYLSDSLLKLSQGQATNRQLRGKVNLKDVVTAAIKKTTPLAKQKDISLKPNLTNVTIEGNHYTLTDLVVILIDNAIKYSPNNGFVDISLTKTTTEAIIAVKDAGLGISKKDLPHIFNRFFRSDLARSKTSVGGYGLGLSIAKQIVDEHQGQIDVTSKLNVGTTVVVHLPVNFS